jgi:glycosyltransferase involved in cell wall biosynthesis
MNSNNENKTIVVLPAYNAEKTLESTIRDLPEEFHKNLILVDDGSTDKTVQIARQLKLRVIERTKNGGYGANQKTCYEAALAENADVVIMLHPDNQYDARVVSVIADIISLGICDVVLGNRIRTRREALDGGMPKWKYFINRLSTFGENFILGQTLGDFHSGLRGYSGAFLRTIPFHNNSDDFAFDQELLVQAVHFGFKIGDVPVPVRYFEEASSINFKRSLKYGFGGVGAILSRLLHLLRIRQDNRLIKKI